MPDQAQVTSLEAIERFRTQLILFLAKARPLLDEVQSDLRRTLVWLQDHQRPLWERQLRQRTRALEDAKQALFSAQLSGLRDATSFEQAIVHKTRRAVDEAEDKLRRIRTWTRDFGPRTEFLARQLNGLDDCLAHDMTLAVARLAEIQRVLESYAGIHRPASHP